MTRHYCDICKKELFSPNQTKVLVAPSVIQEYDLCGDCKKAIKNAKDTAEIEAVKELRRMQHE
jgi:hypothetical protein